MRIDVPFFAVALLTGLTTLQADAQPRARRAAQAVLVTSQPAFGGNLVVRAGAPTESARVDMRQWSIAGGQRLASLRLPFRGLLIVELRAGEVTTIINGERVMRREGEIWSVPAESTMQLETGEDAAILYTTLIGG
jgi:quercetin dioxygenase-like cupin family protein